MNSIKRLKSELGLLNSVKDGLFEKEALLTLAEGIAHLGSWEISVERNSVKWSDELYNIYGFKDKDFQPDKTINEEVIAPEYREKVLKALSDAMLNKTAFAVEYQIIQPSGKRKYVLNQGLYVEKEAKLVGAVQDVTELKEAVLKLKINESLLREAEAVSHSGSWEWIEERAFMLWSDEMYNIHGYPPHSIFINLFFYKNLVHEDDRLAFINHFNRVRKSKEGFKINYRIVRPSGEIRHVLATAEYKRIGLNDKYAFIGNTRDVTELREAQVQLEEKVVELNRSNLDLEQFAYIASHDLQEPLRKIQRFSEKLKSKLSGLLDTEASDYLNRMNNSAERMRALIDDLLAFSKATRASRSFAKVRLDEVVYQAIHQLDVMIELKKADIQVHCDMEIDGIGSQLVQLFQNLIGNSLKFTYDDIPPEIIIHAKIKYGHELKIAEAHQNQVYCIIEVIDNGIGFEETEAVQIFDVFYRLHNRADFDGTGIGLAICKKITDNHSGFISAKAAKGKGAVFTVVLPRKQIRDDRN